MIKTLKKVCIEGKYLNIIMAIYDKLTANIIFNGEKLKAFPLRSTQFWKSQPQQLEKKKKENINWRRREEQLSLFTYEIIIYLCVCQSVSRVRLFVTLDLQPIRFLCPWISPGKNSGVGCHFLLQGIMYIENLKYASKLESTSEFHKIAGINIQKSVVFLYTNNDCLKEKLRKQFHIPLHQKE